MGSQAVDEIIGRAFEWREILAQGYLFSSFGIGRFIDIADRHRKFPGISKELVDVTIKQMLIEAFLKRDEFYFRVYVFQRVQRELMLFGNG